MRFYSNCINWPTSDVHVVGGLVDLIDQRETIDRDEFIAKIDDNETLSEIERQLSYTPDFRMQDDWHVEYFISTHHSKTVYGFRHSAIEYVWLSDD